LLDSKIESVPRPVPFRMLRNGSREARWNVDRQACLVSQVPWRLNVF